MIYFAVVAAIGLFCGLAFTWPMLLALSVVIDAGHLAVRLWQGDVPVTAALSAFASGAVLQLGYAMSCYIFEPGRASAPTKDEP